MAGLNVNDVVRFIVHQTQDNQTVMNTFAYRVSVASTSLSYPTAIQAAINAFATAAASPVPAMVTHMSSDVLFNYVQGQVTNPTRKRYFRGLMGVEGEVGGVSLPVNSAVVIERFTEFAGRKEQGSIHLAGVPINLVEDSVLTPGGEVNFEGIAIRLVNPITVVGETTVMVPILADKLATTANRIIGTILQHTIRVMRRRTVGLGI